MSCADARRPKRGQRTETGDPLPDLASFLLVKSAIRAQGMSSIWLEAAPSELPREWRTPDSRCAGLEFPWPPLQLGASTGCANNPREQKWLGKGQALLRCYVLHLSNGIFFSDHGFSEKHAEDKASVLWLLPNSPFIITRVAVLIHVCSLLLHQATS